MCLVCRTCALKLLVKTLVNFRVESFYRLNGCWIPRSTCVHEYRRMQEGLKNAIAWKSARLCMISFCKLGQVINQILPFRPGSQPNPMSSFHISQHSSAGGVPELKISILLEAQNGSRHCDKDLLLGSWKANESSTVFLWPIKLTV